jgi:MarR family transcriptional regulator, organic hydroperoxide resistance regulator
VSKLTEPLFMDTMRRFLLVYRYMRKYGREMQGSGLSGRAVSILRYLLDAGPLTVGQCRDYLYINDSSTSELIAQLEQAGHVTRTRSRADNRAVLVELTAAGRAAAQKLPLGGIPLLREKLKALPSKRLAAVNEALAELQKLLEIADEC